MENQEPWGPTFSAGYTLSPETAYGVSVSTHPTQGPAYPERWPTVETSAAPMSAAISATVAPTAKAESAIWSSEGYGISGGANRGGVSLVHRRRGVGGVSKVAEERLNAVAYNNA